LFFLDDVMMSDKTLPDYAFWATELKLASLAVSPAEVHGLLLGMLAAGLPINDKSWQPLLFDYTNDGMGWPTSLTAMTQNVLDFSRDELSGTDFKLTLLLPEGDNDEALFQRGDAMAEMVNHFISGLGLMNIELKGVSAETQEALADLEEMAKLAIDEEDDLEEQEELLEQVVEHIKACMLTVHAEFGAKPEPIELTPTIH
jgi:uncharacterized protein YgfB (UPF0149 family)